MGIKNRIQRGVFKNGLFLITLQNERFSDTNFLVYLCYLIYLEETFLIVMEQSQKTLPILPED